MEKNGGDKVEIRLPKWLQQLLFGGAVTSIGAAVYLLAEKEPRLIIETMQKFGPATFLGLVSLVIFNRGMEKGIAVLRDNTAAMQKAADAVNQIASKDSHETYEQRILLGHIGTTMEKVLMRLEQVEQHTSKKAHGASA